MIKGFNEIAARNKIDVTSHAIDFDRDYLSAVYQEKCNAMLASQNSPQDFALD